MANNQRKLNYPRIIGWGLLVLIILAIALTIIKIKIWDRGVDLDTTIDDNPEFDYETIDIVTVFPPSAVRDDDDGVLTIVMFGNDTYAEDENGYNLISDTIAKEMNAEVYNFCLPNSDQCGLTSDMDIGHSPWDAYCLYGLVAAAANHDYSGQHERIPYIDEEYQDYYLSKITEMEALDFDKVDIFMYCYDGHDFQNARPHFNNDNPKDIATTTGAIDSTNDVIYDVYPGAQIIYLSPTYCEVSYNDGYEGCDTASYGYGTLPTTVEPIMALALANTKFSYIDLYIGSGIHKDTASEYLTDDHIVPNAAGKQRIADRILKLIKYVNSAGEDQEE